MKNTELLVNYARNFGTFTALLPSQQTFPCVVVLGLRNNSQSHPHGIEADFLQFVAKSREAFPGNWPTGTISADGLRYDGGRIIISGGGVEYWLEIDRNCPVTLWSCTTPPDDFERMTDIELLTAYMNERPHRSSPLSLGMQVPQMRITEERAPRPTTPQRSQTPYYERPTKLKSTMWLLVGVVLVVIGALWLGEGARRGVAVNFYGWAIAVLGAVLIVRRGLDLIFPPSRM